jgi:hypothetical protein
MRSAASGREAAYMYLASIVIDLHTTLYIVYRSFSRQRRPLRCLAKSTKSAHAHWVVRNGSHLPNLGSRSMSVPSFGLLHNNRTGEADWRSVGRMSFTNHPMRMCGFRGFCQATQ